MIRESLPRRLKLHAFVLGWLCFVALPGLLASALPEPTFSAPSISASHHVGKLVRPEIGVAITQQPADERSSNSDPKRPDPALVDTAALPEQCAAIAFAIGVERALSIEPPNPPYSSRAPPRA